MALAPENITVIAAGHFCPDSIRRSDRKAIEVRALSQLSTPTVSYQVANGCWIVIMGTQSEIEIPDVDTPGI